MRKVAIIVAGGIGTRMKADTPKQFLEIDGMPIVVHTISRFLEAKLDEIVVVLPVDHLDTWASIALEYFPDEKIIAVPGGAQRSDSVQAGLAAVGSSDLVAVHDAVRPFVSTDLIERCFASAQSKGSGVAAVALKDSLRKKLDDGSSEFRNRTDYVLMQTPQAFRTDQLKDAYTKVPDPQSDDATVFEIAGYAVHLVEGEYANVKITTPEDLA